MGKFSELLEAKKLIRAEKAETSKESGHSHLYEVNEDGNGKTTKTMGSVPEHIHKIEEFEVKEENSHIHDIPEKKPKVNEIDAKKRASEISRFFKSMDKKKIQHVIDVIDGKEKPKGIKLSQMTKDIRDEIMSNVAFGLNDVKAGAQLALNSK